MIPLRMWAYGIAVVAVVGLLVGIYERGRHVERREWEVRIARESLQASERARLLEAEWAQRIQEAELERKVKDEEIAQKDRELGRLRIDTRGLRDRLAAASARLPTLEACRHRLRKVEGVLAEGADLLGECQDVVREGLRAYGECRADLSATLAKWPVVGPNQSIERKD